MKHLFIVNPTAGGKDSTSEVRAKVEEAFSTREGQYEIYVTRAPLDATEKIKSEGYKLTTPMIVCNTDAYKSVETVKNGKIKHGAQILKLQ